jgi:hypothetical protein
MRFGLVIEFIEHFQIVTTSNYSAVTNSHTQQFTTARTKSFQSSMSSPVVSWYWLPMADVPLLWVSELSRTSATSFQQQQLATTELQFSD